MALERLQSTPALPVAAKAFRGLGLLDLHGAGRGQVRGGDFCWVRRVRRENTIFIILVLQTIADFRGP